MTKQELARKSKNKDLLERMKNGENLALIDGAATWWPPGKIIEKDKVAIKAIYGDKTDK